MIYSVHAFVRRKPLDYPIVEFEDREEAIKAATSYALLGGDYIIKVTTDERDVEYPSEGIYVRGVRESNRMIFKGWE